MSYDAGMAMQSSAATPVLVERERGTIYSRERQTYTLRETRIGVKATEALKTRRRSQHFVSDFDLHFATYATVELLQTHYTLSTLPSSAIAALLHCSKHYISVALGNSYKLMSCQGS